MQSSQVNPVLTPIDVHYLMCTNVVCYRDQLGRRYLSPLWYKDLVGYLDYLPHFTLAAPSDYQSLPSDAVRVDNDPRLSGVQFVDLPAQDNLLTSLRHLPAMGVLLWKAIGRADVVQLHVAGWPIPLGWLASPLARLQRKPYVVHVESAFWRTFPGVSATRRARLRAALSERLARGCVNHAALAIFTQSAYQRALLTQHPERGHIVVATWIDDAVVLSDAVAAATWRQKLDPAVTELRVLFVGRLHPLKGIRVLLDAVQLVSQQGLAARIDILGEGELWATCQQVSRHVGPTRLRLLGTLPYDQCFFDLLREYHVIVVPSLSDEQPRIVFDAYSQAIPVLASNTDGLREVVQPDVTGRLLPPNNAAAWAEALTWAAQHRDDLQRMGLAALPIARHTTASAMHGQRHALLQEMLDDTA